MPLPTPTSDVCLACYLKESKAHVIRDISGIVIWLKDNPNYYLELVVDGGEIDKGTTWATVLKDGTTLWKKIRFYFLRLLANISRNDKTPNKNLSDRIKLTPGVPTIGGIKTNAIPMK